MVAMMIPLAARAMTKQQLDAYNTSTIDFVENQTLRLSSAQF